MLPFGGCGFADGCTSAVQRGEVSDGVTDSIAGVGGGGIKYVFFLNGPCQIRELTYPQRKDY